MVGKSAGLDITADNYTVAMFHSDSWRRKLLLFDSYQNHSVWMTNKDELEPATTAQYYKHHRQEEGVTTVPLEADYSSSESSSWPDVEELISPGDSYFGHSKSEEQKTRTMPNRYTDRPQVDSYATDDKHQDYYQTHGFSKLVPLSSIYNRNVLSSDTAVAKVNPLFVEDNYEPQGRTNGRRIEQPKLEWIQNVARVLDSGSNTPVPPSSRHGQNQQSGQQGRQYQQNRQNHQGNQGRPKHQDSVTAMPTLPSIDYPDDDTEHVMTRSKMASNQHQPPPDRTPNAPLSRPPPQTLAPPPAQAPTTSSTAYLDQMASVSAAENSSATNQNAKSHRHRTYYWLILILTIAMIIFGILGSILVIYFALKNRDEAQGIPR